MKPNYKTMKWEGISVEQMEIWEKMFPDVNVLQVVCVDMMREIEKKLTRENDAIMVRGWPKNKKDWKKTIVNWLKSEQRRAVL
jgi:hypothetical protein